MEDLIIDGRIICVVMKSVGGSWAGLMCLRIRINDEVLLTG